MPKFSRSEPTHIHGEFYFATDPHNWILVERYKGRNGAAFRDIGFYGTPERLSYGLANLLGRSTPADDLKSLIRALERLTAAILARLREAA